MLEKKQASLTPQYLDVSEWVGRPVIREELHKLHLLVDTDTMYHITVAHLFENKHHMKLGEWVFFSLICYCISYASHHHPLHHTWEAYSNCVAVLFICQHFRLCLSHNFFSTNCRISDKLHRTVDHHELIILQTIQVLSSEIKVTLHC